MATTPTTGDIPSNAAVDLKFNSEQFDRVMNSDDLTYTDRFGKKRITMKGVQELANGFQDTFTNLLGSPDGFKLIGGVKSFDTLRSTPVKTEGQRIFLKSYYENGNTGGGIFIGHIGTKLDDGGTVAQGVNFYWERDNVNEVQLDYFGIGYSSISDTEFTDYSIKLQAAVDLAVKQRLPLVVGFPGYSHDLNYGIYIANYIDISGLSELRGSLNLFVDSSKGFSGKAVPGIDNTVFVLVNLNGTFDNKGLVYNTPAGQQKLGEGINIRQLAPRSGKFNVSGQCHVFSGTTCQGGFTARNFYGYGVYLGSCWDSTINEIRTYACGSQDQWGMYLGPFPASGSSKSDELNNSTFNSLFVHDCFDKALFLFGTSLSINHIHQERTYVSDVNSWVDESPTVSATDLDRKYINNFIYLKSSSVSQAVIYENADTQTANAGMVNTYLRTNGTHWGTLLGTGCLTVGTPLGSTLGDGDVFGNLLFSEIKIANAVRANIDSIYQYNNTLSQAKFTCYSRYANIRKINSQGTCAFNQGIVDELKCDTVTAGNVFIGKLESKNFTSSGEVVIDAVIPVTSSTMTCNGKTTIKGGKVGSLTLGVLSDDSLTNLITGLTGNTLACNSQTIFNNCNFSTWVVNQTSFSMRDCSGYTLTYTGTAAISKYSKISGSLFSSNFVLNGYFNGDVNTVSCAMFQIKGAGNTVSISNSTSTDWNLLCASGWITAVGLNDTKVSNWPDVTTNVPALGSVLVNPNTGIWKRYTNAGWTVF